MPRCRFLNALLPLVLITLIQPAHAQADQVELAWDANSEPDLAGYYLLYGNASGVYTETIDVGNRTTYVVDLADGNFYYFIVRAYSSAGLVSGNSNEVWTWVGDCAATISPASRTHSAAAGTGTVSVAATGCGWTASSNDESWLEVTSGTPGAGNGTVSYSVRANPGGTRTGTLTVAGHTFTVTQQAASATLSLSPSPLRFGAVNTGGGSLGSTTQVQRVTVTAPGPTTWTATANRPWIQVTSGSGVGTGSFTVGVVSSAVLPATGTVTGTVTVTAVGGDSAALPVFLTLYRSGSTSQPFGQVDTPLQNASGQQGAIGVTGWVLDDVDVTSVEIFRNCLGFDNPASCQWVGGHHVAYVGEARFVAGARPDVEAAYSTYPMGYRGGWGYLMLTNMLPHVSGGQPYGGQGPLTLYVFASDRDGHQVLLGRTQTDHTPTSLAMANDTIAKPFGAIDTPSQGETVSGMLANFGWALTPDTDTVAGNGDIEIPPNGSTVVVFVDGVATAAIGYNHCRGSVGTPPPGGVYCDDDVANIFGNPTPQATFTVRTGNPTKHRNLDAGRGAIGSYNIDTTTLANGLHSIAWSVTDSAGRVEGIGSRNFIVLNGSADAAAVQALGDEPVRAVGRAEDLTWRPVADGNVWGRSGFDPQTAWRPVEPLTGGERHVRLPEMGRVELYLGAGVTEGYLRVGDTLRPLPPGSQLADGHFTWVPGPAYLGPYSLLFARGVEQVPVTVTIQAASAQGTIEAYIDAPSANASVRGPFVVAGWAADPTAWAGTGIGAVHVWAHRRDVSGVPPTFLGAGELNVYRPDVGMVLGEQFERAGWHLTAPSLPAGQYDVIAYFGSQTTGRFEDARVVQVTVR